MADTIQVQIIDPVTLTEAEFNALTSQPITAQADSVTELENLDATNFQNSALVKLKGYYEVGDGGAGDFFLDNTGSLGAGADNGGTIFTASGGENWYWVRLYNGPVNAYWFGARGDGVSDDTSAIYEAQKIAGEFRSDGPPGEVVLDNGVFLVAGLVIDRAVNLRGINATLKCLSNSTFAVCIGGINPELKPISTGIFDLRIEMDYDLLPSLYQSVPTVGDIVADPGDTLRAETLRKQHICSLVTGTNLTNASTAEVTNAPQTAILIASKKAVVQNVTIEKAGIGVFVLSGDCDIENPNGGNVEFSVPYEYTIEHCNFESCLYGTVHLTTTGGYIGNCSFHHNYFRKSMKSDFLGYRSRNIRMETCVGDSVAPIIVCDGEVDISSSWIETPVNTNDDAHDFLNFRAISYINIQDVPVMNYMGGLFEDSNSVHYGLAYMKPRDLSSPRYNAKFVAIESRLDFSGFVSDYATVFSQAESLAIINGRYKVLGGGFDWYRDATSILDFVNCGVVDFEAESSRISVCETSTSVDADYLTDTGTEIAKSLAITDVSELNESFFCKLPFTDMVLPSSNIAMLSTRSWIGGSSSVNTVIDSTSPIAGVCFEIQDDTEALVSFASLNLAFENRNVLDFSNGFLITFFAKSDKDGTIDTMGFLDGTSQRMTNVPVSTEWERFFYYGKTEPTNPLLYFANSSDEKVRIAGITVEPLPQFGQNNLLLDRFREDTIRVGNFGNIKSISIPDYDFIYQGGLIFDDAGEDWGIFVDGATRDAASSTSPRARTLPDNCELIDLHLLLIEDQGPNSVTQVDVGWGNGSNGTSDPTGYASNVNLVPDEWVTVTLTANYPTASSIGGGGGYGSMDYEANIQVQPDGDLIGTIYWVAVIKPIEQIRLEDALV